MPWIRVKVWRQNRRRSRRRNRPIPSRGAPVCAGHQLRPHTPTYCKRTGFTSSHTGETVPCWTCPRCTMQHYRFGLTPQPTTQPVFLGPLDVLRRLIGGR